MKNTEEFLNKLASRARLEKAPAVDVADGVIVALQRGTEEETSLFAPFAWVAAASVAVAIPVAVFALAAWDAWTASLISIISEIPWGIL